MAGDELPFDEMLNESGEVRPAYLAYGDWLEGEETRNLRKKSSDAEALFRRIGVTFNVYGEEEESERLIPFDIIPRIISSLEWSRLTRGIEQRIRAINAFLNGAYENFSTVVNVLQL